jgi:ATP-dependent helicase HrpB
VPAAVLDALAPADQQVVVLEPRRIAARLAARFVATERGAQLGGWVGYQVRFENVTTPQTRLRYVTEGVFLRQLLDDPMLHRVHAVVFDEFHERHLQSDLALAFTRSLQRCERPDLQVVVMSATLDTASVASFLDNCPVVSVPGRRFEVVVSYQPPDDRPVAKQVASAVRSLAEAKLDGDLLVFLPGAAEIREAFDACAAVARDHQLELVALHGNLPTPEQARALAPCEHRKVILSTNVAESSVTIEGVVAVVDSGLARVAAFTPWSGLPSLRVAPISRASAAQRAGRAGRTSQGRCVRLYSQTDLARRPEHDVPEIRRLDLAEALLQLRGLGVDDLDAFPWFEAPDPAARQAANQLLRDLGALDDSSRLLPTGRDMLRFPVHPRVARLMVEGERRGVPEEAALFGALLSEREVLLARHADADGSRRHPRDLDLYGCDLLAAAARLREARRARFAPSKLHQLGLDPKTAAAVDRAADHLSAACRPRAPASTTPDDDVRKCVLVAYPDRVARRIRPGELALSGGGTALLSSLSEARESEFVVATDAEQRQDQRGRRIIVRSATAIEPEWLLEIFPQHIDEPVEVTWNSDLQRVDAIERLTYRSLCLDETRDACRQDEPAARLLADQALSRGVLSLVGDQVRALVARVALVREHCPGLDLPTLDTDTVEQAIRALCVGLRSLQELQQAPLCETLRARMTPRQRSLLDDLAPERIRLPGGRNLQVHYEAGQPPWVASRLQDFFGMAKGPAIAAGRVPLVLHLLAPNQRAVQITRDLASFWDTTYAPLRKELCRRYPKHAWPEDGRDATPPAPGRLKTRS